MSKSDRNQPRPENGNAHASGKASILYDAAEAVGVLPSEGELQAAVDDLLALGFDRSQISVLAMRGNGNGKAGRAETSPYVTELEDDPRAPLGAFVSSDARAELEGAAVGVPVYLAGIGGYIAVVAAGGSLAFALAALLLAGAAGASLGGLLAHTISRRHRKEIATQMARGGLLLWVRVRTPDQEKMAEQVLNRHHARHVHVHDLEREWGVEAVPFHDLQPDPFLERDPSRL